MMEGYEIVCICRRCIAFVHYKCDHNENCVGIFSESKSGISESHHYIIRWAMFVGTILHISVSRLLDKTCVCVPSWFNGSIFLVKSVRDPIL